jgi:hypothetical protein
VLPVVPARVDYELTEFGETLLDAVEALVDWAIDQDADSAKARARYDDARPPPGRRGLKPRPGKTEPAGRAPTRHLGRRGDGKKR